MRWPFRRRADPDLVEALRRIRDLLQEVGDVPHSELVARAAASTGHPTEDVEFLLSAMGSYRLRGVLGSRTHYDAAHRAVFRAMEELEREGGRS